MYKFKNNYNQYLVSALTVILCAIFIGNANAFQVRGGGNNLQVIQTNQAKSASFQVNAKLKPTARMVATTSFSTPPPTTPVVPVIPTPTNNSPIVAQSSGGSDSSSPHTGTADWSKIGRSALVTARRKLAATEALLTHTSAPKEIIKN